MKKPQNESPASVNEPSTPLSGRELESRLLHEADGLLVINKPPGLPTSGRALDDPDCLQHALMARHGAMVWAVHQLDADTSGINVFVLEKRLVPVWQARLRYPVAEKTYLALVDGVAEFDERRIELSIGSVGLGQLGVCSNGKGARSRVRVRSRGANCSLVEVMLETGRTHQIRIHMAALGHPLLGEDWYLPEAARATPGKRRHARQALHAWKVRFAEGDGPSGFDCPLPPDLRALAESLGLAPPP